MESEVIMGGRNFKLLRPKLKYVSYQYSKSGVIRVNMIHKKTKKNYHKWLDPIETLRFKESKEFKKEEPILDEREVWVKR